MRIQNPRAADAPDDNSNALGKVETIIWVVRNCRKCVFSHDQLRSVKNPIFWRLRRIMLQLFAKSMFAEEVLMCEMNTNFRCIHYKLRDVQDQESIFHL